MGKQQRCTSVEEEGDEPSSPRALECWAMIICPYLNSRSDLCIFWTQEKQMRRDLQRNEAGKREAGKQESTDLRSHKMQHVLEIDKIRGSFRLWGRGKFTGEGE